MSSVERRTAEPTRWIFGYGSLIWRPSFAFLERRPATLDGFVRRFWQGSTDHRGVPGAPGRVVTLVAMPDARVWGIAYRVEANIYADVLASLDVREQGGYERREVDLVAGGESIRALVYLAGPTNDEYLGDAALPQIVEQIASARGPSGDNSEYVLELARALREASAEDEHVFEIERLLRRRWSAESAESPPLERNAHVERERDLDPPRSIADIGP